MEAMRAESVSPGSRRSMDMAFGAVVMGTVGVLIGWFMGEHAMPVTGAVGIALGVVVGWLGGRRFLVSILVGTVLGGLLAWLALCGLLVAVANASPASDARAAARSRARRAASVPVR